MEYKTHISRRNFLKKSAVLAATAAFPGILNAINPSSKREVKNPKFVSGDKVNLACCGIGNRGKDIIKQLYSTGLCNIVALCDTDMEAAHTLEILKMFPNVPRFRDFRQMFDRMKDSIDAVSIGTPDHSHFPIAMRAMSEGIHVYVEKPLARTFLEVELLMAAARKYKVVTQMGNQGHSEANYFQFKAWTEAGIIKDVTRITAHMNNKRRWHQWDTNMKSFPAAEPIPDTLDWDTWIGVEPMRDYNHDYINGQWRCWYDLGLGALGDWGAHIIDTAHEFLDLGLPEEINMLYADGWNPFFFPLASTIEFKFPARGDMPPVEITWYDGLKNLPPLPDGYVAGKLDPNIPPTSQGAIQPSKLNPGKIIYGKDLIFQGGSHGSTLSIIPKDKAKEIASRLPEVPESPSNHYANFLLAVMCKEKARSPFEISGPLSQVLCLGVIAQRLNSHLKFDRQTKRFVNNEMANFLLQGYPPRDEWKEFFQI